MFLSRYALKNNVLAWPDPITSHSVGCYALAQATVGMVFFPAGLMVISRLTSLSEHSIFTGAMMGISSIVGAGMFPVALGAVADNWNFQIGIFATGLFVIATYMLFRQLRDM